MKTSRFQKGFTLIELLIVITIIGILAVALLPSVLGAPARARDAARKADLNNVIAALETFNSDKQRYPAASFNITDAATCGVDVDCAYLAGLFSNATPPTDPQGKGPDGAAGTYTYCELSGNPASYVVVSYMEQVGDANAAFANLLPSSCGSTAVMAAIPAKTDSDHVAYIVK